MTAENRDAAPGVDDRARPLHRRGGLVHQDCARLLMHGLGHLARRLVYSIDVR
jgi:hypothetical protein